MQSNIISGIVRINRPDGKTAGTGFVVSDSLIATCAHVIPPGAEPKPGMPPEKVELVFRKSNEKRSAHVVAEWWRPADAGDVALLKLDGALPEGVRPLLLGSSLNSNDHAFQEGSYLADENRDALKLSTRPYSKVVATSRHWNSRSGLQLNHRRLAGRGLERRPKHSAGGPQADSRNPGRKREKQPLLRLSVPSSVK
jgi:hypothetical protein